MFSYPLEIGVRVALAEREREAISTQRATEAGAASRGPWRAIASRLAHLRLALRRTVPAD